MKKTILFAFTALIFLMIWSCSDTQKESSTHSESTHYIPHLGQMMLSTQIYHTKLYYAGNEQNWDLAEFYTHELTESLEDIIHYYPEYEGLKIKELTTNTALKQVQNLEKAVEKKSLIEFQEGFTQLTNSCNACHVATQHPFIKIKTPEKGDFQNQIFLK
ncbi:MAG: hypothetical protein MUF58_11485 [Arcicella sp.]|jgi:hypothetical protein|nr:hypothetical protein [Arcicella sp.]